MTTDEALAQREELRATRDSIQRRIDDRKGELEQIRREESPKQINHTGRRRPGAGRPAPDKANAELAQARVDAARGLDGADKRVKRLERRVRDVEGRIDAIAEGIQVDQQAKKAVDADLVRLHREEYAAFAEHAESVTEVAHEKLAELREAYEEAVEAWEAARLEWLPIAQDNGFRGVSSCPLPAPEVVFERSEARPTTPRPAPNPAVPA